MIKFKIYRVITVVSGITALVVASGAGHKF
jgi:hypothetical protein